MRSAAGFPIRKSDNVVAHSAQHRKKRRLTRIRGRRCRPKGITLETETSISFMMPIHRCFAKGTANGAPFGGVSRPGYAQFANLRPPIARAHCEPFRAKGRQMGVDWRRGLPYKRDAL